MSSITSKVLRARKINNDIKGHYNKSETGFPGISTRRATRRRAGGIGAYNIAFMNLTYPPTTGPPTDPDPSPPYSNPVITINGEIYITIEKGVAYDDAGATAEDYLGNSLTSDIVITNTVDTSYIGTSIVRYNVSDSQGNAAAEVTRTVNVVDTTKPVITMIGNDNVSVLIGTTYSDAGATALDFYNLNLTPSIVTTSTVDTSAVGTYTVKYNVKDVSLNIADEVVRTVTVYDSIVPLISLLGSSPTTVEKGDIYVDAGATALDNDSVDLTSSISVVNSVDMTTPGTYSVTYNVKDSSQNSAVEVIRVVNVVDTTAPVIYLIDSPTVTLEVGDVFTDAGATASDYNNDDLTSSITVTSDVDTSIEGSYTVAYNVQDASGNSAIEVVRNVIVESVIDYLIIGAGPSASMAAYVIAESKPDKNVLLLEKGEYTLEEYKSRGYDDVFMWADAQNDSDFMNNFDTTDNKNVWLGNGFGGGTLIFGLQYIDNEQVLNDGYSDWKDTITEVTNIMQPEQYSYTDPASIVSLNAPYMQLKATMDATNGVNMNNNKVYASDFGTRSRLLVADKTTTKPNISINYNTTVKKLSNTASSLVKVETFDGTVYKAKKCLLCAGSIQSTAIVKRSGITSIPPTLADHAGFTCLYGKLEQQTTQTTTPYSGDYNFVLTPETLSQMYAHSYRYVYSISNVGDDNGNVYDFTAWSTMHSGGSYNITKWVNSNHNLEFPASHGSYRSWESNKGSIGNVIGTLGGTINYNDLSDDIKSDALKNALFPDTTEDVVSYVPAADLGFDNSNILSHVQSRDSSSHKWMTYYSTLPQLENYLVLTHAQTTNLPMKGEVNINSDANVNPVVTLNHFGEGPLDPNNNEYVNDIYEAFTKNHEMLTELGYTLFQPNPQTSPVTKELIAQASQTIYHYQSSLKDAVDSTNKLNGMENVYVGDISTLQVPYGGSTSVAALATGYRTGTTVANLP